VLRPGWARARAADESRAIDIAGARAQPAPTRGWKRSTLTWRAQFVRRPPLAIATRLSALQCDA
jgi:hypothetical protein